jgi:hypothetical protein
MSDLKEVGRKLCALCAEGKYDEAMATLYAPDAVQAEAFAMPGMERETKGLEAIGKAAADWAASTEIHSATTSKPFFFPPDRFACIMEIDCSHKEGPMQGRHQMKEICVYTVKDGKIVRAEFFYDMPEGC